MIARERALLPVLVFLGAIQAVISSLGAPVIPTIARETHSSLQSAQWSLTATALVGAIASPLVGRLGDGPRRRPAILACATSVLVGGVLAAATSGLPLLLVGRALQGMGIAMMPLTMAIARHHLNEERAGRAIAVLSAAGAIGVGLGYPLTGLIVSKFDVSVAFGFGAVMSAIALVLCVVFIPGREREEAPARPLDLGGAVLVGGGLLALLVALEKAPDWGWGSDQTLLLALAAAVSLALWARHELRTTDPIVDLRLVRHRAVLAANTVAFITSIAMYTILIVTTQFTQLPGVGLGKSVFVAGLILVPFSVLAGVGSRTLPAMQRRLGSAAVIPLGCLTIAVSAGFYVAAGGALWVQFATLGGLGIAFGWTYAAMPGLIVGAVPQRETGSAMGFYQVTRYVGFSIGSGMTATLLRVFGHDGAPTGTSFRAVAGVVAGLGLLAALLARLLTRDQGPPGSADETAVEEGLLATAGLEGQLVSSPERGASSMPPGLPGGRTSS